MKPVVLRRICAVAGICLTFCTQAGGFSFQGLGDLPGSRNLSRAYGVSADGTVVVGFSASIDHVQGEAFIWSADRGMIGLGGAPGDYEPAFDYTWATDVSADGSVVSGLSAGGGFRWTEETGIQITYGSPGLFSRSPGDAVSDDGRVIVGGNGYWTADEGRISLGLVERRPLDATSVSGNGDFVSAYTGDLYSPSPYAAYRWERGVGAIALGNLPGKTDTTAWGISADGQTVVGSSGVGTGPFRTVVSQEAFAWTPDEGMFRLGDLPGGGVTSASDASADGSIVVGTRWLDGLGEPFVWKRDGGIHLLGDLLSGAGISEAVAGWSLGEAHAVSNDGFTLVGTGTNPQGDTEAWIATIPEPGCLAAFLVMCLHVSRRAR